MMWCKPVLVAMLSLPLCGCITSYAGTDAKIYPIGLFGQRVVGNEAYVTVSNIWNEMDGLPLAEQHCRAHQKVARFNRMEALRAVYDCVKA